MKSLPRRKWLAVAAGVVLAGAGVAAICRGTPGCLLSTAPRTNPIAETSTNGGKLMSTVPAQGTIEHAGEADFQYKVLGSTAPVLVDFYADWCRPCQMLAPVLEELARETPDAKIVKVNVDDSPALAAQYGISAIPSLLVFKGGQIAAERHRPGQQGGLEGAAHAVKRRRVKPRGCNP